MSEVFENLAEFDFSLPALSRAQMPFLLGKKAEKLHIYVGTEGWNNKFLAAKLYPSKTKIENYLRYYSELFNSVEVASTKFGLPKKEVLLAWYNSVPENFKFSFKVPQYITHKRNFDDNEVLHDMANFIDLLDALEHKIGMLCFSLPASFTPSRLPELFLLLKHIPKHYPCAIEFRNSNFYKNPTNFYKVLKSLAEQNVSTLFTDATERRDMLHMCLSTKTAYIKIMGISDIHTDLDRVHNWAERVAAWAENGLEKVYLVVNEPGSSKPDSLVLAKSFLEILHKNLIQGQ